MRPSNPSRPAFLRNTEATAKRFDAQRVCPAARLWICPATGHTVNIGEPDLFNRMLGDFLALVDSSRWRARDPRSIVG